MFTPTIEFWHFRLSASNASRSVGVPFAKVLPSAALLDLRRTPHCPPGQYAGRLTFWGFSIPRWVFRRALSLRCWLSQRREAKGSSSVKRFEWVSTSRQASSGESVGGQAKRTA